MFIYIVVFILRWFLDVMLIIIVFFFFFLMMIIDWCRLVMMLQGMSQLIFLLAIMNVMVIIM